MQGDISASFMPLSHRFGSLVWLSLGCFALAFTVSAVCPFPTPCGHYCDATQTVVSCTSGSFAFENASSCTPCPAGFYCTTSACNTTACVTGDFCPPSSESPQDCPGGSYCSSPEVRLACGAGSYCPVRSTAALSCPTGYYCNATGLIAPFSCKAGTYNNNTGSTSSAACIPCTAGDYCGVNSTDRSDCPAGSYCSTPSVVYPCKNGSYCPPRSVTEKGCGVGCYCATPSSESTCPVGSYCPPNATAPSPCTAGHYCNATGMTAPLECAAGTYNSNAGSTTAADCNPCAASGDYCATAGTVNSDCPAAYYCPNASTKIACSSGSYCPPRSVTERGCGVGCYCATPSSESTCPVGSYCLLNATAPSPCPTGHYCNATGMTAPLECAAGTYSNNTGSTACTSCSLGDYCGVGSTNRSYCPAGSFCSTPSSPPQQCPVSTFCPARSTAPSPCSAGGYCDAAGLSSMRPCPAGTYNSLTSQNSSSACLNCSVGDYCAIGSVAPSNCTCQYYCPTPNSRLLCGAGTYSPTRSTSASNCTTCSAGYSCAPNSCTPVVCPNGTYCATASMGTPTMCPCGYYCFWGPASLSITPHRCPLGHWCPSMSSQPLACDLPQYCNNTGLCRPSSSTSKSGTAFASNSLTLALTRSPTQSPSKSPTSLPSASRSSTFTATSSIQQYKNSSSATSSPSGSNASSISESLSPLSQTLRVSVTLATQTRSASLSSTVPCTVSKNSFTATPTVSRTGRTKSASRTADHSMSITTITLPPTATPSKSRTPLRSPTASFSATSSRTASGSLPVPTISISHSLTKSMSVTRSSSVTRRTFAVTDSGNTITLRPTTTSSIEPVATPSHAATGSWTLTPTIFVERRNGLYSAVTQLAMSLGSTVAAASTFSASDPSSANLLVLVASTTCDGEGDAQLRGSVESLTWFKSATAATSSLLTIAVMVGFFLLHLVTATVFSRLRDNADFGSVVFFEKGCAIMRFPNLSIQMLVVLLPSTLLGGLAGCVLDGEYVAGVISVVICVGFSLGLEALLRLHVMPRVILVPHYDEAIALFRSNRALCGGKEAVLLPSVYWEPMWMTNCFGPLFNRMRKERYATFGGVTDLWLSLLTAVLRVVSAGSSLTCTACSSVLVALYFAFAIIHVRYLPHRSPVLRFAPPLQFVLLATTLLLQLKGYKSIAASLQLVQSCILLVTLLVGWYLSFRERTLQMDRRDHIAQKQQHEEEEEEEEEMRVALAVKATSSPRQDTPLNQYQSSSSSDESEPPLVNPLEDVSCELDLHSTATKSWKGGADAIDLSIFDDGEEPDRLITATDWNGSEAPLETTQITVHDDATMYSGALFDALLSRAMGDDCVVGIENEGLVLLGNLETAQETTRRLLELKRKKGIETAIIEGSSL